MSPTMNNLPERSSLHGNFTPLAILFNLFDRPCQASWFRSNANSLGQSPISFQTRNAVVPLARRSR
jgi:hypothetical protein